MAPPVLQRPYCADTFSRRSSLRRHIRTGACEALSAADDPAEAIRQLSVDAPEAGEEFGVPLAAGGHGLVFGPDE